MIISVKQPYPDVVGGELFILLQNNVHCGPLLFGGRFCQIKTSREKNGENFNSIKFLSTTVWRWSIDILGYLRYQCVCMLLQRHRNEKSASYVILLTNICTIFIYNELRNTTKYVCKKLWFFEITLQQYPLYQPILYCFPSSATSRHPSSSSSCKCTWPLEFSSLVSSMCLLCFKLSSSQIRGRYYLVKIDIIYSESKCRWISDMEESKIMCISKIGILLHSLLNVYENAMVNTKQRKCNCC